jgi:hypothetical protein
MIVSDVSFLLYADVIVCVLHCENRLKFVHVVSSELLQLRRNAGRTIGFSSYCFSV